MDLEAIRAESITSLRVATIERDSSGLRSEIAELPVCLPVLQFGRSVLLSGRFGVDLRLLILLFRPRVQ